jgi:hypothetical protein
MAACYVLTVVGMLLYEISSHCMEYLAAKVIVAAAIMY